MLIPIAEKTLINKKIQFTTDYNQFRGAICYGLWSNCIRVLINVNNDDETYAYLSTNYYTGPNKHYILYAKEMHIKIFLNTINNLPYYEIKTKN